LTFEEAINMSSANGAKDFSLFCIFIENMVITILVLSVVDHILIKADAGLILGWPETTIHLDAIAFLRLALRQGGLD
jgi:hypothetical protein